MSEHLDRAMMIVAVLCILLLLAGCAPGGPAPEADDDLPVIAPPQQVQTQATPQSITTISFAVMIKDIPKK